MSKLYGKIFQSTGCYDIEFHNDWKNKMAAMTALLSETAVKKKMTLHTNNQQIV